MTEHFLLCGGEGEKVCRITGGVIVFQGGGGDTEWTMFVRRRVGWEGRVTSGMGVKRSVFKVRLAVVVGITGVNGVDGMDGRRRGIEGGDMICMMPTYRTRVLCCRRGVGG